MVYLYDMTTPINYRAITGLVIALLSTCVLMVTGYACQLQYFLNTNFTINFCEEIYDNLSQILNCLSL